MLFFLLVQVFFGDNVAIRKDLCDNSVLSAGLVITMLTDVTNAATYSYSNVHAFSSVATTSCNVGFYLPAGSTSVCQLLLSEASFTARQWRNTDTSKRTCISCKAPGVLSGATHTAASPVSSVRTDFVPTSLSSSPSSISAAAQTPSLQISNLCARMVEYKQVIEVLAKTDVSLVHSPAHTLVHSASLGVPHSCVLADAVVDTSVPSAASTHTSAPSALRDRLSAKLGALGALRAQTLQKPRLTAPHALVRIRARLHSLLLDRSGVCYL